MGGHAFGLDTPLEKVEFTVIDTETTGLNPEAGHQIIEVGMARYTGGNVTGTFETLLRPTHPLSPEALVVHKITPEQLSGAHPIGEMIEAIIAFLGGTVVAAHNVKFDMTFLHTALHRLRRKVFDNWTVDTIYLSQALWPDMKCHCLMCMAGKLKLSRQGTHRALEDVLATVELLDRILIAMRAEGKRTLGDLGPRKGDFGWGEGDAYRRLEDSLSCAMRRGERVHLFMYDSAGCSYTGIVVEPLRVEKGTLHARVPGEPGEREFPLISITKALAVA